MTTNQVRTLASLSALALLAVAMLAAPTASAIPIGQNVVGMDGHCSGMVEFYQCGYYDYQKGDYRYCESQIWIDGSCVQ